jgi:glutamyl-tRNA reductase
MPAPTLRLGTRRSPLALTQANLAKAALEGALPGLVVELVEVVTTGDRDQRELALIEQRQGRPLVLVDLAVPRDIDPSCGELPGVDVFDLDDLERVVSQTFTVRGDAVAEVEQMASEATEEFGRWLRAQDATPAIRAMRERAEAMRAAELERFLARMTHLAAEDRRRIEQLTRSIVNRMLHAPTQRLREAAERQ